MDEDVRRSPDQARGAAQNRSKRERYQELGRRDAELLGHAEHDRQEHRHDGRVVDEAGEQGHREHDEQHHAGLVARREADDLAAHVRDDAGLRQACRHHENGGNREQGGTGKAGHGFARLQHAGQREHDRNTERDQIDRQPLREPQDQSGEEDSEDDEHFTRHGSEV